MKKMILIISMILAACASQPLTPQEKAVRILKKSDAPSTCQELEKVHSPGLGAFSDEGREENLKRATAKVGGNLVTVDKTDDNNTIYGTAWKCK